MKVPINQIRNNPYNTRQDYGDLYGLITSIKRFGLTQPFLARKIEDGYQIAFGSRRYEALKKAGEKNIDIEVKELEDKDMAILSLCENVHRKDLNAIEQARAYEQGLKVTRMPLEEFAEAIGVNKQTIKDYVSILRLPQEFLKSSDKYGKSELIYLGKLNSIFPGLRIMMGNVLENKSISSRFVREICNSCESVYASALPDKTKKAICGDVIFHDYSSLAPENYRDIKTFSDSLLGNAIFKHQEGLKKTAKARAKLPIRCQPPIQSSPTIQPLLPIQYSPPRKIKKIDDIVHADRKLDEVISSLRDSIYHVKSTQDHNYYKLASKRGKRKFKTVVNHLVSGIEEILKNE